MNKYSSSEQTNLIIDNDEQNNENFLQLLLLTRIYPIMKLAQNNRIDEKDIINQFQLEQVVNLHKKFQSTISAENFKSLKKQLLQFFLCDLLKIFFVQLIQLGSQLLLPFIIQHVLEYVNREDKNIFDGWILLITIMSIKIISLLAQTHSKLMLKQTGYNGTSLLSMLIMDKNLRISLQSQGKPSIGEITNLLQVDAQKLILVTNNLINVSLIPIQLGIVLDYSGISIWYIYNEIGIAVLVGITIIILTLIQNHFMGKRLIQAQKLVLKSKDSRIKLTNEVFQQIKFIKINAFESIFQQKIEGFRQEEMNSIDNRLDFFVQNVFIGWLSPQLILSLSFALYVYLGNVLTPSKVFPIISLLLLLASSLQILPISINQILDTSLSLQRIEKFLGSSELQLSYRQWFEYQDSNISLSIRNGTFFWNQFYSENTLKNISIDLQPKKFISFIGDVGSGKSSILQLILGEMNFDEQQLDLPKVIIYGSIAYVGQKAWIQNCTVKKNILFGKQFHKETYDKALYYSCLKQDLDVLINGDQTMIGEKGVTLSGGQKARISLARAIYSDADIYLLDDPLSAVDVHVANFIMQECFLNCLKNKTRILCTHMVQFCQFTDYVYFLQNREIIHHGDFSSIVKLKEIEKMLQKYEQQFNQQISITEEQQTDCKILVPAYNNPLHQKSQLKQDSLMLEEDRQLGSIEALVFHKYFMYNGGLRSYVFLFVTMFIWIVLQLTSNIWIANWSNQQNITQHEQSIYVCIYFLLGLLQAIIALVRVKIVIASSLKSSTKIHNEVIDSLLKAPICEFFERVPIGRIMNRLTKDINSLDIDINMNISLFSTKISQLISSTILALITSSKYIIFPFIIFFYISLSVQRIYMKASRELQRLELISKSPVLSYFVESLQGLTYIRAYQAEERFLSNFGSILDKNRIIVYASTQANCWFTQILGLASLIVNMSAISYCVFYSYNAAFAGLILTYVASLDVSVQQSIDSLSQLENNMISFERCLDFTKIPQEADNISKIEFKWPSDGIIEFVKLSVKYRPNLPNALQEFSYKINSQEKIGIVGRTGAGKSTITLSLLRVLEAIEGQILIDNVDIQSVPLHQLRKAITSIQQDAIIFHGTVRQNLDPLSICNDDEILRVIEDCCLTKLLNERNGLDAIIQEDGNNLSAGERQLICIARAILKKSKIVLIDEATANIDIQTEKKIQETIQNYFKNCTVITIAHRISTILNCDKILVIDKGELIESGKTEDLLKNQASQFFSIYQEVLKNQRDI